MATRKQPPAHAPIHWPRADPQALAGFNPQTKVCTMNCGRHAQDPRSNAERLLLCEDCLITNTSPNTMTNPLHTHLTVTICEDAADAIARGFDYNAAQPGGWPIKPIEVKNVVVVRNGTQSGKSSVDFLLEDETGQRFVFMVTGALLKSIPC
jgi:hypothetical protein